MLTNSAVIYYNESVVSVIARSGNYPISNITIETEKREKSTDFFPKFQKVF